MGITEEVGEELSEIFLPLSAENVSFLSLSEGFFEEKRLKHLQIKALVFFCP